MVPLSFSFLMNEMAIEKPKSPHMPKNLKPVSILMRALSGDFQRSSCVDKIRIRDMIQLCQFLYCGVVSFGD